MEKIASVKTVANSTMLALQKDAALSLLMGPKLPKGTKEEEKAKSPTAQLMMQDVRGGAALEKGTAAAFSQERRSNQQSQMVDLQRKALAEHKKATAALTKIAKGGSGELQPARAIHLIP